jgi:hypothetical protein
MKRLLAGVLQALAFACRRRRYSAHLLPGKPQPDRRGRAMRFFLIELFVLLPVVSESTAADIFPVKCDLVILGEIEASDEHKFQSRMIDQLKRGCSSPKIFVYSPGGHLGAAMQIGEQIYQLRLTTVAPRLIDNSSPEDVEEDNNFRAESRGPRSVSGVDG